MRYTCFMRTVLPFRSQKLSLVQVGILIAWFSLAAGCADEYVTFHGATGEPLLLTRRGYSNEECFQRIQQDANQLGVTLRYIHVKGSTVGQSLLWPFEPGYACEAAIGPTDIRRGIYPREEDDVLSQLQ